ncbi:hypothetical protein BX666DRAFT_590893 [Dichotomocladium elegans]|nr:hypothetical protein BX666DRAFT_590893 [Dichotomocladium elegans]
MQQASLRKSARIATQPAITYYNKRPISTVEGATRKRAAPAKTNSPISAVPTISTDVNPVIQDPQHNKDIVNQGPTALVQSVLVRTFDMHKAVAHLRKVDQSWELS